MAAEHAISEIQQALGNLQTASEKYATTIKQLQSDLQKTTGAFDAIRDAFTAASNSLEPVQLNSKAIQPRVQLTEARLKILDAEYTSLREEISRAKSHVFRLCVNGILGIPIAVPFFMYINSYLQTGNASNFSKSLSVVSIVVPFLILGLYAIYLAETLSVWRCAKYIRDYIEHVVNNFPDLRTDSPDREEWIKEPLASTGYVGWETWLYHVGHHVEHQGSALSIRQHDHIVVTAFSSIMVIYYVVACIIACLAVPDIRSLVYPGQLPFDINNDHLKGIILVVYGLVGIGVCAWLIPIRIRAKADFHV